MSELIEAWRTNQRVHRLILENLSPEGLASTLSTRGGRDVSRQLAHLHTQRLRWLDAKGGADLTPDLPRFESREHPDGARLLEALDASCEAVATYLEGIDAGTRKAKGLKKGVVVAIAYLISHESHHRGNILLTLKQCGHRLDKAVEYGIWDWQRL